MPNPSSSYILLPLLAAALAPRGAGQDSRGAPAAPAPHPEVVFSGPQIGEKVPGFRVLDVQSTREDREFDPAREAKDDPTLYLFFAPPNRVIARAIATVDAIHREAKEHGLRVYVVGLLPDRLDGDQRLREVWGSLRPSFPALLSVDGLEGPGAWGLNKRCQATFVIAKGGRVTFNLASLGPSEDEFERVREAVSAALGRRVTSRPAAPRRPEASMREAAAESRPLDRRRAKDGSSSERAQPASRPAVPAERRR
jgi:hypothetical protein